MIHHPPAFGHAGLRDLPRYYELDHVVQQCNTPAPRLRGLGCPKPDFIQLSEYAWFVLVKGLVEQGSHIL
jgi:hypothetical protein